MHGGEKVHVPVGLGIGKREVVGYGNCGQENYVDHVHYPFPAIRFKVIILAYKITIRTFEVKISLPKTQKILHLKPTSQTLLLKRLIGLIFSLY